MKANLFFAAMRRSTYSKEKTATTTISATRSALSAHSGRPGIDSMPMEATLKNDQAEDQVLESPGIGPAVDDQQVRERLHPAASLGSHAPHGPRHHGRRHARPGGSCSR